MTKTQANAVYGEVIDAISRFLASPPEGTPSDILAAFDLIGGRDFLPPNLFLETVEQAPIAISITDTSAHIIFANSAFETLTGYPRDEVIGMNQSVLSSNSTPVGVYQELWKTIKGGDVWTGSVINNRKDGEEYLAELTIAPVLKPDGRIGYFLGMHRDTTELHALQRRLAFQKSLTEAALDAAPMVVAIIDSDRRPLLDNHAYKALLGDLRGTEPVELFLDALKQQIGFEITTPGKVGDAFTNVDVRLDLPGAAEPRWFACSGARIGDLDDAARSFFRSKADGGRSCLLLIANEITEKRNRLIEARLNMIRANVAEQQMIQTMREAISAALFKMQAPLNIIKASMNMANRGGQAGASIPAFEQALAAGEEAVEALHHALPSPRREESTSININELLHEVLRLSTDRLLAAGVVVDLHPATVLPPLVGRANGLRALFKYLVDNAVQAVSESGRDYREVRIQTSVDDSEIVVEIMDNGLGIPDATVLKVFEPFYCDWRKRRGHAGMGLTLAQEVVVAHGGSIDIDRHFLGGCRVFVRLPHGDGHGGAA